MPEVYATVIDGSHTGRPMFPVSFEKNGVYTSSSEMMPLRRMSTADHIALCTSLVFKEFQLLPTTVISSYLGAQNETMTLVKKYFKSSHVWHSSSGFVILARMALLHFPDMFKGRAYFTFKGSLDETKYISLGNIRGLMFDHPNDYTFMEHLLTDLSWGHANG
ncbi:hypothetical protein CL653_03435 [bacterium]|nr:hypothetical protein [bacterium]